MTDAEPITIDADLARRLVTAQFPQWAHLPVTPVAFSGHDNRTFHLGEAMTVRLPSAAPYAAQAEKEQLWLPRLAPRLPLPIPAPLGLGRASEAFPWCWSVYGWIEGQAAERASIPNRVQFARDLAAFLTALHAIDASEGPAAGQHNFFRGGPLATYDRQTRKAIGLLGLDGRVTEVWEAALASEWRGRPVWVHGDVAAGNLLVRDGRLSAVIDFGILGVGDPACDLAIAWTFLDGEARAAFREVLPLDADTWTRGLGWTLWKALIVAAGLSGSSEEDMARSRTIIADLVAEHT